MRINTTKLAVALGTTKQSANELIRKGVFKTAVKEGGYAWTVEEEEVVDYLNRDFQINVINLNTFLDTCLKRVKEIEETFFPEETKSAVINQLSDPYFLEKTIADIAKYDSQVRELERMKTTVEYLLEMATKESNKINRKFKSELLVRIEKLSTRIKCYHDCFKALTNTEITYEVKNDYSI